MNACSITGRVPYRPVTSRDVTGPPLDQRALRPAAAGVPLAPNGNDPATVPPATVGPPAYRPGDPDGVIIGPDPPHNPPPRIFASPWSGWPAEWATPSWGRVDALVDAAWMCLDLNASILSTMPPYVHRGGDLIPAPSWVTNPDPELYTSWAEFAKQVFWDYQLGEAFIVATAHDSDGYPARFHAIDPWLVDVEIGGDGLRHYRIGNLDPGPDLLHIRYKSTTSTPRGCGPLDAGRTRIVAAGLLQRYAARVIESGGVPYYVMKHPLELGADQISDLQNQWFASRMNALGMPAILSGGIDIETLQVDGAQQAMLDLARYTDSRIANLLGVPPFLVGLPAGGDSLTYSTALMAREQHWQAGLKPKADPVVAAISGWALTRTTALEIDRDEYVPARPARTGADVCDPRRSRCPGRRRRRPPRTVQRRRGAGVTAVDDLDVVDGLEYRYATGGLLDVRFKDRVIELIVIPYNEPAAVLDRRTGRMVSEQVDPGAFAGVERRANRVKVNRAHDVESVIGRAQVLDPGDPRGLRAELKISRTVAGDEALELAADGALDASAGFRPMAGGEQWATDRRSRRITRAYLGHVALTGDPAYDGARVLAVRSAAAGDTGAGRVATPNLDLIALAARARAAGMTFDFPTDG